MVIVPASSYIPKETTLFFTNVPVPPISTPLSPIFYGCFWYVFARWRYLWWCKSWCNGDNCLPLHILSITLHPSIILPDDSYCYTWCSPLNLIIVNSSKVYIFAISICAITPSKDPSETLKTSSRQPPETRQTTSKNSQTPCRHPKDSHQISNM